MTPIDAPAPQGAIRLLLAVATAAAVARAVYDAGGARRVASLALHRLRYGKGRPHPPEESRLYARGRHRLEAHLGRRPDGRRVVLTLSIDAEGSSALYRVGERRPWHDFERQARLVGAAWGPCRSASAGL